MKNAFMDIMLAMGEELVQVAPRKRCETVSANVMEKGNRCYVHDTCVTKEAGIKSFTLGEEIRNNPPVSQEDALTLWACHPSQTQIPTWAGVTSREVLEVCLEAGAVKGCVGQDLADVSATDQYLWGFSRPLFVRQEAGSGLEPARYEEL